MGKVEVSIENPLITKNLRADRVPTVFSRAIRRLSTDKKHPGKLIQIYANIDNDYKVFGVFTINTGGSISFFPDFFNLDNFDHLTLTKDFIQTNAHFTKVTSEGKHKKIIHFVADELPTGDYHLITFVMQDGDLLMDSLPVINFPDIYYEGDSSDELFDLLQESLSPQPIMLQFPNEPGLYCIQILVVPKGKSLNEVSINRGFEKIFELSPIGNIVNANKIEIPTSQEFEFSVLIVTFKIQQELKTKFGFAISPNPEKPIDKRIVDVTNR